MYCAWSTSNRRTLCIEDGSIDHGDGEGMYAEIFVATMESAAFLENDIYKLIDIGFSYIPTDCKIAQAVHSAMVRLSKAEFRQK